MIICSDNWLHTGWSQGIKVITDGVNGWQVLVAPWRFGAKLLPICTSQAHTLSWCGGVLHAVWETGPGLLGSVWWGSNHSQRLQVPVQPSLWSAPHGTSPCQNRTGNPQHNHVHKSIQEELLLQPLLYKGTMTCITINFAQSDTMSTYSSLH